MAKQREQQEYDYIVVGGGTAGCVIAGRLAMETSAEVLLIEAGRADSSPFVRIPAGVAKLGADKYEWGYQSEPQRHCGDLRVELSQAKVLGGGGSINAQVFTRGIPFDYDRWGSEFGAEGWDYDRVAPVFRRFERNQRLSSPYHGVDGPVGVSDPVEPSPLSLAFVKAGQEAGLPFNSDFNGASQHGVGLLQSTTWNGFRCSTSTAYLKPARKRPNLTIRTHGSVDRVVVHGQRAVAVDVTERGQRRRIMARREIILCSGAFGSPHVLQLSGVGDPAELRQAGIPVVHDLPGVGKNLQDHARVDMTYGIHQTLSMDRYQQLIPGALAVFQYAAYRRGPLASTLAEAGAFAYADKDAAFPDQQIHFVPAVTNVVAQRLGLQTGHGVMVDAYALRPESRGTVRTVSGNPRTKPLVDPNFLATDYDVRQAVGSTKLMREIMRQPSMAALVSREFLGDYEDLQTEADYVGFAKANIGSACHPTGTCSMGDGPLAVLSGDLKVRGLEGLRVADSSVMPAVVSCNTQAPTIMVAERAVDFILEEALVGHPSA